MPYTANVPYDVDKTPITMIITERLMAMPFANQGVNIVMAVVHTHLGSYYQEWQQYYQMMKAKGHMNLQCMIVLRSPLDAALLYEQSQTPKDNPVRVVVIETASGRELDDGIEDDEEEEEEEPAPSWKEPNDYTKDGW